MYISARYARKGVVSIFLFAALSALILPLPGVTVMAQGTRSLSTVVANNGQSGVTFEITATRPTRLYRFWSTFNVGTWPVEIWTRPNGASAANDGQWQYLGTANVTSTNATGYSEIPLTLNLLMNANETRGFFIFNTNGSNLRYRSGTTPYIFSDTYISINTQHYGIYGSTNPGNGTTNLSFAFYPRQFCGAVYYDDGITGANDAGVLALTSPENFCAGTLPVKVKINNYGSNQISSLTINWELNGVAQTPYQWSGLLDTLTPATRETEVTLSTQAFAANVPYTFKIWTSNPNGQTDTVSFNDTLGTTRQAAIAGTFTIGGSSPDFPTIASAVAALNNYGICGPVVFNIRPGVYTGQVGIGQVTGTSSTNTVTFQSETGLNTDVTIMHAATSTSAPHTLLLDGADWFRFRNLTFQGTGTSYARIVVLQGGATNNLFENNRLVMPTVSSTSNYICGIYSYYTNDHQNTFRGNTILNGAYGVYYYGSGTGSLITGMVFERNSIRNFYYMGIAAWYFDAPEFVGNTVSTTNTYTNYLFYAGYLQNRAIVSGNRLEALGTSGTKYGLYYYYYTAQPGNEALITNNMITLNGGSSTVYGFYSYYSNNGNVDFNTVNIRSTSTASRALYSYYGSNIRYTNNIFYNTNSGYAMYFYYTTLRGMDYNVIYNAGGTLAYWNGTSHTSLASLQAASGQNANSISKPLIFRDPAMGDQHLAGASQNDVALTGMLQPYVSTDIDGDPRILPYRGADEACYILPNTVSYKTVDANGNDIAYTEIPGTLFLNYSVAFPDDAINLTITVNLHTVPGNQLAYQYSFTDTKLAGQTLVNTSAIPIPSTLGVGYYRVEVLFNTKNSCGDYINFNPGDKSLLAVPQGQSPCIVWPGDVTNDGIVNYGDRSALNKYIFNANLRPSWLNGPARYRPDAATNPMTYYTWEGQPAAPWQTPEGCYMDADGNGVVNTFDMLPTRTNWLKTHGAWGPKTDDGITAGTFDLSSNYPNPFNPSTTLQFTVPEKSAVRIVVTDLVGREVAVLVNGAVDTGIHSVVFNAASLESGVYIATARMTGESGLSFTKSIRMTLAK